jgi:hypothetical protein
MDKPQRVSIPFKSGTFMRVLLLGIPVVLVLYHTLPAYAGALSERRATIFFTAQTHGTLEPCGCTSDPLGDVARVTALVRMAAKDGPTLLVDAGGLTYPLTEIAPEKQEAADLVAEFLAKEVSRLPFGGSALGSSDMARGEAKVQPRRLAANLSNLSFLEVGRVHQVGEIKIGVFGLADPALGKVHGWQIADPVATAQAEAERLRSAGAELVIALAPLDRSQARMVARKAAVDFVVLGKSVGQGSPRAEQEGQAFILMPADEMQRVGRLEIVLRDKGAARIELRDAGSPEGSQLRAQQVRRELEHLSNDLSRWEKDAEADSAFLRTKREEHERLRAEEQHLSNGAWTPPSQGSYFVNRLVPIRRSLPRDRQLAASMRKLDLAVGAANLRAAQPPDPAEPGRAHFSGDASCVRCHKASARFYKKTRHAHAWKTLQVVNKTAHHDCVSCHVTGYGEVGGSSVGFTKGLENVQCETCHGPGSIHVEKRGLEKPLAIKTQTPEAVCTHCHNEKHSDTFQYQAYLREIVGPGHGEEAFDKLGPGPTARDLRKKAAKQAAISSQASK